MSATITTAKWISRVSILLGVLGPVLVAYLLTGCTALPPCNYDGSPPTACRITHPLPADTVDHDQ